MGFICKSKSRFALRNPFAHICRQHVSDTVHRAKKLAADSTKRTAAANF